MTAFRRRRSRGASLVTYAAVIGLVALGVSVAVSQTGDQVSGLTARVAGSVNAVDGAISGNKGPSYQGLALADQTVDEFDPVAQINARGFLDPEGDVLSYHLALTGGLDAGDFTVQQFPDGVVIDGTPGASGTLAVVATDPIGRRATAGPMQITVDPNAPPVFSGGLPSFGRSLRGGTIGPIQLPEATDSEVDAITYRLIDDGSGMAAQLGLSGGDGVQPLEVSGSVASDGLHRLWLVAEDEHGATETVGEATLEVLPPCSEVVAGGMGYEGSFNCYLLQPALLTRDAAEASCQAWGGRLASIGDASENAFVMDTVAGGNWAYVGFTDEAVEGVFTWMSGEPVTYTNWHPNEPNNSQGVEDCTEINFHPPGSVNGWNDIACSHERPSVCEFPR